ncbi:Tim44 domain-containing protein [Elioraea tepidiphila]|jgi:predicted lipid-binding transport protein (Tim44 family)|uniref:Tim44 domain-containing protein n=1 Tax=Elioraea tepidiphila TaxID=457934 RepID=UPI00037550BE|nr:TIM44-like domain-containing protein [Elioraea tepidiphila]
MRRFALYAALAATLTLALAPAIAEARIGRGGSFGTRGGQTYAPPPPTRVAPQQAQPVQRNLAQPAAPTAAAAAPATAARPGFGPALMGGLLAGGLIGLMLGSGFFGAGLGGVLGALLQLALIGGLIWLGLRLFRAAPAMAGAAAGRFPVPDLGSGPLPRSGAGFAGGGHVPLRLTEEDLATFEAALKDIQAAWSEADTAKLGRMLTPEMLGYVAEQLDEDARRGVRNRVSGLVFEEGDVSEAWREGVRDYATVAMRFSLTDVDVPVGAPPALPGAAPRETVTELWTFVRVQGGPWLLSAIQQTGTAAG